MFILVGRPTSNVENHCTRTVIPNQCAVRRFRGAAKFGFHCNLLGFLVKSSIIYWCGALNYFFKYVRVPPILFSKKRVPRSKRLKNTALGRSGI